MNRANQLIAYQNLIKVAKDVEKLLEKNKKLDLDNISLNKKTRLNESEISIEKSLKNRKENELSIICDEKLKTEQKISEYNNMIENISYFVDNNFVKSLKKDLTQENKKIISGIKRQNKSLMKNIDESAYSDIIKKDLESNRDEYSAKKCSSQSQILCKRKIVQ